MNRKKIGALTADEKLEQDLIEEIERERVQKIEIVNQLVHGEIRSIDNMLFYLSRPYEIYGYFVNIG